MVIAISGKAQSGKDTIFKMIQKCIYLSNNPEGESIFNNQTLVTKEFTTNCYKQSFAEFLKQASSVILEHDRDEFEDSEYKNSAIDWLNCSGKVKGKITVREFLQHFGSAMRETFGESFWAQTILSIIPDDDLEECINVFTDLRYKVELEELKKAYPDTILIRVNRREIPLMQHSSEIDLDDYKDWDYVIENNGTLDELYSKVESICKELHII